MSEQGDSCEARSCQDGLLEIWRARALAWLGEDARATLHRAGLLDALLYALPGFRLAGDESSIVVYHEPSLVPNVAFEAHSPDVLWRLLYELVGSGRVAVASVDEPGRLLLRSVALVELELPRLQLALGDAPRLWPPSALRLEARDRPAILELVRASGGLAFAVPEEGEWYGIREAGRLVSIGSASERWPGVGEISNVITHPDHRRRGYASAVASTLAVVLLSAGLQPFLEVFPSNEGALRCYEQLGFVVRQQVWRARFLLRPAPDGAPARYEPATLIDVPGS